MSVRLRVTLVATFTVAVVLAVTGWWLVAQQRRTLTAGVDDSIEARAIALAASAAAGTPVSDLVRPGDDDQWVLVTDDAGTELAAEQGVPRAFLARTPRLDDATPSLEADGDPNVVLRSVDAPDGEESWRLASLRVTLDGRPAQVHVAGSLDDVDDSVQSLRDSLLFGVPIVVLVLAAATWVLIGRSLAPVDSIRATVDAIGGSDLSARVPVPRSRDEVGRLARTMNSMLERAEAASERQRQFVGDAAHELRSPIARMRTRLDVDSTDRDQLLRDLDMLQRLVDDLLDLARHDEGKPLRPRIVDLDEIATQSIAEARARRDVRIDASGVSAAQVLGDPAALRRVVDNLLDNACRHAATHVAVTVVEEGESAVLEVADDGPGIPDTERERVFERFTRLDEARRHGRGTGLGLAIVRDVVVAHGGTVEVASSNGSGARLVVRLPLRD